MEKIGKGLNSLIPMHIQHPKREREVGKEGEREKRAHTHKYIHDASTFSISFAFIFQFDKGIHSEHRKTFCHFGHYNGRKQYRKLRKKHIFCCCVCVRASAYGCIIVVLGINQFDMQAKRTNERTSVWSHWDNDTPMEQESENSLCVYLIGSSHSVFFLSNSNHFFVCACQ